MICCHSVTRVFYISIILQPDGYTCHGLLKAAHAAVAFYTMHCCQVALLQKGVRAKAAYSAGTALHE